MLGIGANSAIFSVVNAVLLKPLPFPEPDRLVMLMISADSDPVIPFASAAQFMHYRAQTEVLADVAAFSSVSLNYTGGDSPDQISAQRVSEAFFRTFGAPIARGRGFTVDEDVPGARQVTVISHEFWTQYLGADPDVVGDTVSLSGNSYTVVGIAASSFDMREFRSPELWIPLQIDPNTTDQAYSYQVAARLKPGITLSQAQERLEASVDTYRERFPSVLGPRAGFTALPMQEAVVVGSGVRTTLFVFLGAVGLLLLIACANVANLLLARAAGRRREFGIRSALGASRTRVLRQLLTEGLLLALAGGVLGLIAGFAGMRTLLAIDTAGLPRLGESGSLIGLDWRVAAFTTIVSLATVVVFGLVPAMQCARMNVVEAINDSSARVGGSLRQNKTRSVLVVVEVALAALLLIGAGLLVRTSFALSQVDPGFNPDNLLTMRTSLSDSRFGTSEGVVQTVELARERIGAVPGVLDVTATCCIPMRSGWGLPFNVIGRADEGPFTGSNAVVFTSPGYFRIFDIPVLRGRGFNDADDGSAPPVAIINEALASQHWTDGTDPLEDRILIGGGASNMRELANEPVRQIIGIVGNVRATGLANDPGPIMYVPQAQLPDAFNALVASTTPMAWVVRTAGDPARAELAVQAELELVTRLPVTDVNTMEELVLQSVSRQRLHMLLMSVFACAALVLAAVGVFGVMAYVVQQRTQEIGIRMALGADTSRVRGMVIRQGMLVVAFGLAAGVVAAYYLATVLASVLYQVEPRDTLVFVTIPLVLALVSLAAVAIPASRASRVNPMESVRYE